jgi:hypothetical protein
VIEVAKLARCAGGRLADLDAGISHGAPGAGPAPVCGVLMVGPDRMIDIFDQ